MAWGRRRRPAWENKKLIKNCNIKQHSIGAFAYPLGLMVQPVIEKQLTAFCEEHYATMQPLLDMLREPRYHSRRVKLQDPVTETNIRVKLSYAIESTVSPADATTIEYQHTYKHAPIYGERTLAFHITDSNRSSYDFFGRMQVEKLTNGHFFLEWADHTFGDDDSEQLANIQGHAAVIAKELPEWIAQFAEVNDSTSVAAFYSSQVDHWLTQLDIPHDVYTRRPRTAYTVPMSPALCTALSVSLEFAKANRVKRGEDE